MKSRSAAVIAKTFEVRDRCTFIPVLAVKLAQVCEADRYLIGKAEYGLLPGAQSEYVVVCEIVGGGGKLGRTMGVAHRFIQEEFDRLETGAVVDVEFILGETKIPKRSQRLFDGMAL